MGSAGGGGRRWTAGGEVASAGRLQLGRSSLATSPAVWEQQRMGRTRGEVGTETQRQTRTEAATESVHERQSVKMNDAMRKA